MCLHGCPGACLTGKLTLYTAHGNESVRAYVEAADRLTAGSHSFVRSRIVASPGQQGEGYPI